jgi:heptosyltransferase III
MTNNSQKTLVYHAGALGDFVTTLPAISLWKRLNPEARLTYLGRKVHGDLGIAAGYFSEAIDIDRAGAAAFFCDELSEDAAALLSGFDSAIVFAGADSPLARHLGALGDNLLHQPPFPENQQHVVDYHLSMFPSWEREKAARAPVIRMLTNDTQPESESRCAVIHPGSGSAIKNWPLERYAALSAALQKEHAGVTWLLGPAEGAVAAPGGVRVVRDASLVELCRILEHADLFIGNDSGISHLAAACGCRCIVLFGPSDPAVWRPVGNAVKIISAVSPCGPCHDKPGREANCAKACMEQIGVSTVVRECF